MSLPGLTVHYGAMKFSVGRICAAFCVCLAVTGAAFASAYNANPKLVVIVVIDQFRGDYLDRAHDPAMVTGGFRLLARSRRLFHQLPLRLRQYRDRARPCHAATGAYSDGHGIFANEWWDSDKAPVRHLRHRRKDATWSAFPARRPGASPHNLLTETLGDEFKMATQGRARVFTISLKDRAAVLPGGFSANGAFWIEPIGGDFITSSYLHEATARVGAGVQPGGARESLLEQGLEGRGSGNVLQRTTREPNAKFYDVIGGTPFANDYEFDFARELIAQERLGQGPATDLLVISLSANDILGHRVGPDSPQTREMALALDRQIGDFLTYLGQRIGLANVWVALSADHGIAPVPDYAQTFRIPAERLEAPAFTARLNVAISNALEAPGESSSCMPAITTSPISSCRAKLSARSRSRKRRRSAWWASVQRNSRRAQEQARERRAPGG